MGVLKFAKDVVKKAQKPITVNYPSNVLPERKYSQIPERLRGILTRDKEKCIGCKACEMICSGRATTVEENENKCIVKTDKLMCTQCAHCQDICPEEAIKLSTDFEVAITDKNSPDASTITELERITCANCGTYFAPKKLLEKARQRALERIDPSVKDSLAEDYSKTLFFCLNCKRALSVLLDTHTKKHAWIEVK